MIGFRNCWNKAKEHLVASINLWMGKTLLFLFYFFKIQSEVFDFGFKPGSNSLIEKDSGLGGVGLNIFDPLTFLLLQQLLVQSSFSFVFLYDKTTWLKLANCRACAGLFRCETRVVNLHSVEQLEQACLLCSFNVLS